MKSLTESLFDKDLIRKNQSLPCGLEIDPELWEKCKKYAEKRIKKYFSYMDVGDHNIIGDNELDCVLCYRSKDNLILISKAFDDIDYYIYILCPETVYFHLIYTNQMDPVHLDDIKLANDFSINFGFSISDNEAPVWDQSLYYKESRYIENYMPATIDIKAKKEIERIIKNKYYRESFFKK